MGGRRGRQDLSSRRLEGQHRSLGRHVFSSTMTRLNFLSSMRHSSVSMMSNLRLLDRLAHPPPLLCLDRYLNLPIVRHIPTSIFLIFSPTLFLSLFFLSHSPKLIFNSWLSLSYILFLSCTVSLSLPYSLFLALPVFFACAFYILSISTSLLS